MLRQYALIFVLFLLTFSALLGGVSAQNDIQSEIEDARQKGYDPEDVQQWNLPEGALRRIGKGEASDVAYAPDGQRFAVAGSMGIWICDARTLNPVKLIAGDTKNISTVHFSPDGKTIASGGWGKTIDVWDVNTGRNVKTLSRIVTTPSGNAPLTVPLMWVKSLRFSPDGKTIVSGDLTKNVRLWDANTGSTLKIFKGRRHGVNSVCFSPDGKTIATGNDDGTIRLWNADTGKSIKTLKGHRVHVFSVSFSPDGKTLASAGLDTMVRLWDVSTGKLLKTLTAHTQSVNSVYFSPDGKTIATGSGDDTVHLWDVDKGSILRTLTGHTDGVRRVRFSPDSKTLVSVGSSGTVRLWDVNTGRNIKTLIGHTR